MQCILLCTCSGPQTHNSAFGSPPGGDGRDSYLSRVYCCLLMTGHIVSSERRWLCTYLAPWGHTDPDAPLRIGVGPVNNVATQIGRLD
jgi:hypothetical protein